MENGEEKSKRVQIILSEPQKRFLDEAAANEGVSVSALIRKIVDTYKRDMVERQLESAAKSLYKDYEIDEELTVFTALDEEDFA